MNQRDRYNQGGIGRRYWDYRDRAVMYYVKGSILDVGCGDGITTRKMGAIGLDREINPEVEPETGMVEGSVYSIPFPNRFFDCVTLLEVIEHLARPWEAIAEIRRVLKPGGRLVMLFPNDRTFKVVWFLTGMWGEIGKDRGHTSQWWPSKAWMLLCLSGFKIVDEKSIPINRWPLALHHIIVGEKC